MQCRGSRSLFSDDYKKVDDLAGADAALVRSAAMHDLDLPDSLLAVARAGAGVNNIPLDKCADKGIVVFNTPGANANGASFRWNLKVGADGADKRSGLPYQR